MLDRERAEDEVLAGRAGQVQLLFDQQPGRRLLQQLPNRTLEDGVTLTRAYRRAGCVAEQLRADGVGEEHLRSDPLHRTHHQTALAFVGRTTRIDGGTQPAEHGHGLVRRREAQLRPG